MRFEHKILTSFAVLTFIELSAVNLYTISLLKKEAEYNLFKEIKTAILLKKNGFNPPNYILVSSRPISNPNYIFKAYLDDNFIYVRKGYLWSKLKKIVLSLLMWEFITVISVLLLAYTVVKRFYLREKSREEFLNLLLLSVTHKLGNFLSVQQVNLEILKDCGNKRAIERLASQTNRLKKDFERIMFFMEKLKKGDESKKVKVNVKPVILENVKEWVEVYGEPDRLILSVKDTYINTNPDYFGNIVSIVVENAIKYARSFVHIKNFAGRNKICVIVRNDIGEVSEGRGVGTQIAKYMIERVGGSMRIRVRGDMYTTVLQFRR